MNATRFVVLCSALSSLAFAQGAAVKVQKGNATVKVGSGGNVEVTGADGQKVKVDTSGTTATTTTDDDGDAEGAYVIDGQGRTETHACKADESIELNGQGHVVTLTGTCRSVVINGQGHTVGIEKVGVVEVNGMGNTITWKSAIAGKKPKLVVNGLNNSVKQAK